MARVVNTGEAAGLASSDRQAIGRGEGEPVYVGSHLPCGGRDLVQLGADKSATVITRRPIAGEPKIEFILGLFEQPPTRPRLSFGLGIVSDLAALAAVDAAALDAAQAISGQRRRLSRPRRPAALDRRGRNWAANVRIRSDTSGQLRKASSQVRAMIIFENAVDRGTRSSLARRRPGVRVPSPPPVFRIGTWCP